MNKQQSCQLVRPAFKLTHSGQTLLQASSTRIWAHAQRADQKQNKQTNKQTNKTKQQTTKTIAESLRQQTTIRALDSLTVCDGSWPFITLYTRGFEGLHTQCVRWRTGLQGKSWHVAKPMRVVLLLETPRHCAQCCTRHAPLASLWFCKHWCQ